MGCKWLGTVTGSMSGAGQRRKSAVAIVRSGLPPKADSTRTLRHVRKVPQADIHAPSSPAKLHRGALRDHESKTKFAHTVFSQKFAGRTGPIGRKGYPQWGPNLMTVPAESSREPKLVLLLAIVCRLLLFYGVFANGHTNSPAVPLASRKAFLVGTFPPPSRHVRVPRN
jgi:hypothetical protein